MNSIHRAHFILFVRDQALSTSFFASVFGREPRLNVPGMTEFELPGGAVLGLMPEAGARRLLSPHLPEPNDSPNPQGELYLVVEDPAELHSRALAAGARELSALAARDWGHEAAYSRSPDGHILAFARALPHDSTLAAPPLDPRGSVREARSKDRDAWLRMRSAFWPGEPLEHAAEIDAYFAGKSKFVKACFLFDTEAEGAAGFLELGLRNFAEGSVQSAVPYVEGWYVEEPWRGMGIGARLVSAAESWAREAGFAEIASDADPDNAASLAAHRALGFRETGRLVAFLKSLS